MQQPRMIVLALIAQGRDYGLAMEEFVEHSRMRLWAKIGGSTIYKTLRDLEADGCVTSKRSDGKRGPGKKVFALTPKGRAALEEELAGALQSSESVYSDRIAGLILCLSLPKAKARRMIQQSIDGLGGALEVLKAEKSGRKGDTLAKITLDYYTSIYRAEQKAMEAVLDQILA